MLLSSVKSSLNFIKQSGFIREVPGKGVMLFGNFEIMMTAIILGGPEKGRVCKL